jgi:predicted transglutaminase-like cysteine proteinase
LQAHFGRGILQGLTRSADPQVVAIGDENQAMRWTLPHITAFAAVCAALLMASSWLHAADVEKMQQAAQRQGVKAVAGVKALQALTQSAVDLDDDGRLQAVNQFFNRRIQFRDDAEVWGLPDYWASPLELLEKGQGDCEDYVIAKYFSLLSMGMPSAKLRLVYVRALLGGQGGAVQAHMVLAYYPTTPAAPSANAAQAEPVILDNLISEIRPASRRPDLTPVFSFNSDGLWQGVNGAPDGDPLVRLSRWREVVVKARAEGFL